MRRKGSQAVAGGIKSKKLSMFFLIFDSLFLFLLLFNCEIALAAGNSGEKVILRYGPEEGKTLEYFLERTVRWTSSMPKAPPDYNREVVDWAGLKLTPARSQDAKFEIQWEAIYLDQKKKPLPPEKQAPKAPTPFTFAPVIDSRGKLELPTQEWAIPANEFPSPGILPTLPEEAVEPGDKWSETINCNFSMAPETRFTFDVKYEFQGFEERKGKKCAKIVYTLDGRFNAHDYPERFESDRLAKQKMFYSIKGDGIAYFAWEDGFMLEKQENVSQLINEERKRSKEGKDIWETRNQVERMVNFSMIFEK